MKKIIHFDTTNDRALTIQRVQRSTDGNEHANEIGILIKKQGRPEIWASLTVDEARNLITGIEELMTDVYFDNSQTMLNDKL